MSHHAALGLRGVAHPVDDRRAQRRVQYESLGLGPLLEQFPDRGREPDGPRFGRAGLGALLWPAPADVASRSSCTARVAARPPRPARAAPACGPCAQAGRPGDARSAPSSGARPREGPRTTASTSSGSSSPAAPAAPGSRRGAARLLGHTRVGLSIRISLEGVEAYLLAGGVPGLTRSRTRHRAQRPVGAGDPLR